MCWSSYLHSMYVCITIMKIFYLLLKFSLTYALVMYYDLATYLANTYLLHFTICIIILFTIMLLLLCLINLN